MDLNGEGSAAPSDGAGPSYKRPPLLWRKIGSRYQLSDKAGSLSLGSRYVGKVLIDCKFRFAESQWGTLFTSQTPAGIIYVDLSFNQPDKFILASASVQISLEEYEEPASDKVKGKMKERSTGCLAVTDWFGPKMLMGKPTTRPKKTRLNLTPYVGAMGFKAGGVGINTEETVTYSSQWIVNGYLVADEQDGVPGAVYKTLRWELSENDLCSHPIHSNVIHTGLAFTHEAKPFCIRVEIEGKLRKLADRLRYCFPPKAHKNQGTTVTVVGLRPEHRYGLPLYRIASNLDKAMVQRNLHNVPQEIPDSRPASSGKFKESDLPAVSVTTDPATDAAPKPASKGASAPGPSSPTQSSTVEKLTEILSGAPYGKEGEVADSIASSSASSASSAASSSTTLVAQQPTINTPPQPKEILQAANALGKDTTNMMDDRVRQLAEYPAVLMFVHVVLMVLGLFSSPKAKQQQQQQQQKSPKL